MFPERGTPKADRLNDDVRLVGRRTEQLAGVDGRDELEVTESLSRSSSAAVVTPFSLPDSNPTSMPSTNYPLKNNKASAASSKAHYSATKPPNHQRKLSTLTLPKCPAE